MEAGCAERARDAIAINNLETIAALTLDRVNVARTASHKVLTKSSDSHLWVHGLCSLHCLKDRLF